MDKFNEKYILWLDLQKELAIEGIKMHAFLVDHDHMKEYQEWCRLNDEHKTLYRIK